MGHIMFMRKGTVHTAPISGTLASELAVGSVVKLMENGTAAEYLVVHQGLPSSMYDASCDGTWLLRKDCYEKRQWHSSNKNDYANSTIHSYLNGDFLNLLGTKEQGIIKQVKIPYVSGSTLMSGSSGLATKIFLLSTYEVGYTNSSSSLIPIDGDRISYFTGAISDTRIAYLNSSAIVWWLRSRRLNNAAYAWSINKSGNSNIEYCSTACGIRPALVLPSYALFDKNTLILKG